MCNSIDVAQFIRRAPRSKRSTGTAPAGPAGPRLLLHTNCSIQSTTQSTSAAKVAQFSRRAPPAMHCRGSSLIGPLGLERAQHRRTPSVDGTRSEALCPFGSQQRISSISPTVQTARGERHKKQRPPRTQDPTVGHPRELRPRGRHGWTLSCTTIQLNVGPFNLVQFD